MSPGEHTRSKSTDGIPDLTESSQPDTSSSAKIDPALQALLTNHFGLVQQMITSLNTTNTKFSDLEQKFHHLQLDSSNLASDSKVSALEQEVTNLRISCATDSKVQTMEQDIADLRLALPSRKVMNKPKITDVSTIALPVRPQYELATKNVKLKDLVNSLSAITFASDEIKDIKHVYSKIKQAIDIGCSTNTLLPDIDSATAVPNFFDELVPPSTYTFYTAILASYKTISNALLNFFLNKDTISSAAPRVATAVASVENSTDGFVYLATVLHKLLP